MLGFLLCPVKYPAVPREFGCIRWHSILHLSYWVSSKTHIHGVTLIPNSDQLLFSELLFIHNSFYSRRWSSIWGNATSRVIQWVTPSEKETESILDFFFWQMWTKQGNGQHGIICLYKCKFSSAIVWTDSQHKRQWVKTQTILTASMWIKQNLPDVTCHFKILAEQEKKHLFLIAKRSLQEEMRLHFNESLGFLGDIQESPATIN